MAQNKSGATIFPKQKNETFPDYFKPLCTSGHTTLDIRQQTETLNDSRFFGDKPISIVSTPPLSISKMFTFHLQALFSSFISLPWPFAESPFSSKKSPLASTWVRVAWLWWHNCALCSRALASLPWFWSSFWTFTTALSSLGRFFTWWPPSVLFRISLGTRVVINCFLLIYGAH